MPRWTQCFVDKRTISNEGQWGIYKCEKCGKLFKARMCTKKRAKHVFCGTKCKKDFQVKIDRPQIDNKIFKSIYDENYNLVKIVAFKILENKNLTLLEDCMQEGFLELWKTYNRNKMRCSKTYLKKAIKNAIWDKLRYWLAQEQKYVYTDKLEVFDYAN